LHLHPPQELSSDAPDAGARERLVRAATEKFRSALRVRPDFDRAAYNLGTTLYTHASALQAQLEASRPGPLAAALSPRSPGAARARAGHEAAARAAFATAAQYIALAAAAQPQRDVYRKSLAIVRPLLALPFLRAGPLLAAATDTIGTISEVWLRQWFVLDRASFRTASPLEASLSVSASGAGGADASASAPHGPGGDAPLVIPLADILSVRRCCDPSLPEGEGFWVCLQHMRQGVYFVAADADAADAWADALLLARELVAARGSGALAAVLEPSGGDEPFLRRPSGGPR